MRPIPAPLPPKPCGGAAPGTYSPVQCSQYVFFIRHSESRWNRAQADGNVYGLWCENDHGLTDVGREQAERLRGQIKSTRDNLHEGGGGWDAEYLQRFVDPDVIYTSPFTRAIETAVIALRDLLAEAGEGKQRELIVIKDAREQRNSLLSADAGGIAVGEEIKARVTEELNELYAAAETCVELDGISMNVTDVEGEWWSASADSEEDTRARRDALLERLRDHGNGCSLIVVGHSHLFKEIFKDQLSMKAKHAYPDIAASLMENNIPPGGLVGTRLEWGSSDGCIAEAIPLLNTALTPADRSSGRTCTTRNPMYCTGGNSCTIA